MTTHCWRFAAPEREAGAIGTFDEFFGSYWRVDGG